MEDMKNYAYTLFRTIPCFFDENVCSTVDERLLLIKMLFRPWTNACF